MPLRRFDRDNFAPIVGFHNDEVGCKKCPKNHGANANHAIVPPYAGGIDNFHGNCW